MGLALKQAHKALDANEVPVGCVFVLKGNGSCLDDDSCDKSLSSMVLSAGYNATNESRNGTRHAELVAIDDIILRQGYSPTVFRACDLYVTCEPCIMCAAALSTLGIRRVYFGCHNDRFGGNGSVLRVHDYSSSPKNYEVTAGLKGDEAIALFRRFYNGENKKAPVAKRKRKHDQDYKAIRLEGSN